MTKLLEALLETIPADPIPVRKVIIGVHWTLVSSKYCGLGSTLVGEGPHGHSQIRDVGVIQEVKNWHIGFFRIIF